MNLPVISWAFDSVRADNHLKDLCVYVKSEVVDLIAQAHKVPPPVVIPADDRVLTVLGVQIGQVATKANVVLEGVVGVVSQVFVVDERGGTVQDLGQVDFDVAVLGVVEDSVVDLDVRLELCLVLASDSRAPLEHVDALVGTGRQKDRHFLDRLVCVVQQLRLAFEQVQTI